jgi:plasmid stabilization system protein ParE
MAAKLIVAPETELDVTEAYVWYESRRVGLGEEFLSSLDACIESIRRQPMIYPMVHETYRRALIRRFPYAIFFEHADTTVTVYAVFHTSRNPKKWCQRLP